MLEGGCLCGGVRFAIDARPTPIQICHAKRCQRSTGSAFAAEMAVRTDAFRWLEGEALLRVYDAPLLREPPAFRRVFCSRCGSPLPVVREGAPFVVFLAGSLDDDPGSRPFRHIFLSQRPAWADAPRDDLPQFQERPPADQRLRNPSADDETG